MLTFISKLIDDIADMFKGYLLWGPNYRISEFFRSLQYIIEVFSRR